MGRLASCLCVKPVGCVDLYAGWLPETAVREAVWQLARIRSGWLYLLCSLFICVSQQAVRSLESRPLRSTYKDSQMQHTIVLECSWSYWSVQSALRGCQLRRQLALQLHFVILVAAPAAEEVGDAEPARPEHSAVLATG